MSSLIEEVQLKKIALETERLVSLQVKMTQMMDLRRDYDRQLVNLKTESERAKLRQENQTDLDWINLEIIKIARQAATPAQYWDESGRNEGVRGLLND